MFKFSDFATQFIVASVETSTKLDPIDHLLFTTALDLIGGLIFRVKKTQDKTAETLSRIEKKIDTMRDEQRTEHFDTAFQLLQTIPAIHGSSERKSLINDAIVEFNHAAVSETNSGLTRAETLFWIGYCYDLIKQHDAALQKYAQACNLMISDYISHLFNIYVQCFAADVMMRTRDSNMKLSVAMQKYRNLSSTLSVLKKLELTKSEWVLDFNKYCTEEIIDFFELVFKLVRARDKSNSLIKDVPVNFGKTESLSYLSPTSVDYLPLFEDTILVSKMYLGNLTFHLSPSRKSS